MSEQKPDSPWPAFWLGTAIGLVIVLSVSMSEHIIAIILSAAIILMLLWLAASFRREDVDRRDLEEWRDNLIDGIPQWAGEPEEGVGYALGSSVRPVNEEKTMWKVTLSCGRDGERFTHEGEYESILLGARAHSQVIRQAAKAAGVTHFLKYWMHYYPDEDVDIFVWDHENNCPDPISRKAKLVGGKIVKVEK